MNSYTCKTILVFTLLSFSTVIFAYKSQPKNFSYLLGTAEQKVEMEEFFEGDFKIERSATNYHNSGEWGCGIKLTPLRPITLVAHGGVRFIWEAGLTVDFNSESTELGAQKAQDLCKSKFNDIIEHSSLRSAIEFKNSDYKQSIWISFKEFFPKINFSEKSVSERTIKIQSRY